MVTSKSDVKQSEINWRRDQVIELAAEGCSQKEIAKRLQLPTSTINRDMMFLKEEARKNLIKYTTEVLPWKYRLTIKALEKVAYEMWQIAQETSDPVLKMDALLQYAHCHYRALTLLHSGFALESRYPNFHNGNGKAKSKLPRRLPSIGDMITPANGCSPWIYSEFHQQPADQGEG